MEKAVNLSIVVLFVTSMDMCRKANNYSSTHNHDHRDNNRDHRDGGSGGTSGNGKSWSDNANYSNNKRKSGMSGDNNKSDRTYYNKW